MYVGIDIGTSATKVALVDRWGNEIQTAHEEYGFSATERGYRELDPFCIVRAVTACLLTIDCRSVEAMTVSALGEAIVPVDKAGTPLYGIITGTDSRGDEEFSYVERLLGRERLIAITALNPSTIYSANKILWLKKNRPDIYGKTDRIFTVQDFIINYLCGASVIDYSMASRTMLFDVSEYRWSDEILRKLGIDKRLLSDPVASGTIAGDLKPKLASEFGCMGTARIVVGTHDHLCNAIGAGVYQRGSCSNTVGTTEGLTTVVGAQRLSDRDIDAFQFSCQPFAIFGMYNTVAWNNTSGALLRWYRQNLCAGIPSSRNPYDFLEDSMPDGPTRLLVLPHFSGAATPNMDCKSRGAILGLTLDTASGDIFKALIEGANFELRQILECHERAGVEISRLVSTGNAASAKALRIKADVLGFPIATVRCAQTGAFGGALIGAVACGAYADIGEAISAMVHVGEMYEPDGGKHREYTERFQIYRELYETLKDINHKL